MSNDQGTIQRIMALDKKYPNAIPVFGGAAFAYNCIHAETPDFERFIEYLFAAVDFAHIRKWHEGLAGACRTFCHLCLVDPMLIEAYLGFRFERVAETYYEQFC